MVSLGHEFSNSVYLVPIINPTGLLDIIRGPFFSAIGTATFAVDSFFFLSGFLTFYLLTEKLYPTNGKGNYLMFYVHRYLRLIFPLGLIIIFTMFIFPYI